MSAQGQQHSPLGLGFLHTSSTSTQSSSKSSRRDELLWRAWSEGKLRWLLNENQKQVYDISREWEKRDPTLETGNFPRVFNYDIGRRWGKTTVRFAMRCEDAIRNPGSIYRISSAYQKNIQEIVNDVSRYVLETCPNELRPVFKQQQQLFYFPKSRSEIRLVGLDMHPNGLRGQACDGDDLDEAAFIDKLEYTIKNVLYPQYQGKPWARIYLISSAPVKAESDYDEKFVEDAKLRGAYVYRTIDDNPMLSHEEREEFIRAAGGREHHDCQREYFNIRVRDPEGSVVPEFSIARHVRASSPPAYAHCYVGADPGTRDKFGLVFGYWDFERAKLVIQRSWAERNASLADVAEVIRRTEQELWGARLAATGDMNSDTEPSDRAPEPLQYWDGKQLISNAVKPYRRVSDTDGATLLGLRKDHGIAINGADKRHTKIAQDAGAARKIEQPKLYLLRQWFLNDMIEIWPDSGPLQHQLNAGRWNEQRTDFERTTAHGHLDCMMALVYLLPQIDRNANPNKPDWADADRDNIHIPAHLGRPQKHSEAQLNAVFGKPKLGAVRQLRARGGFVR